MAVVGVGVDAVLLSSTVIQTQFLFRNGVASVFGITVSSNTCKECMNLWHSSMDLIISLVYFAVDS